MTRQPNEPDVESPLIGATVADKYEVESVLGTGGMGTVFAARHTLSGRRVALKTLETSAPETPGVDRFLREAQAMGRIEHPNVVAVLDAGVHQGAPFLVMELLSGESLRAWIEREAPMPHPRAIALLMPALEGVEAAHRAGVVHRDLKPENLFVCRERWGTQTTKVLDFGISKVKGPAVEGSRTQTGVLMGTPYYMSPEQARGLAVDARSDVWSLGVILYELLAGRVPFHREQLGALLVAIATEEPTPLHVLLPELPAAVSRVVHRALAKDPEARWPSVAHLAVALAAHAPGCTFREPLKLAASRPPPPRAQADVPTVARPAAEAPKATSAESTPSTPKKTPAEADAAPEPSEPEHALPAPLLSPKRLVISAIGLAACIALWMAIDGAPPPTSAPPPRVRERPAAAPRPVDRPAPVIERVTEPHEARSAVPPIAPAAPSEPLPPIVHRVRRAHAAPAPATTTEPPEPRRPAHARSGALTAGDF